jgi:hypothetical protein
MCVNFRPSTRETIKQVIGLEVAFDYRPETWKGYVAPIILRHEGQRVAEASTSG